MGRAALRGGTPIRWAGHRMGVAAGADAALPSPRSAGVRIRLRFRAVETARAGGSAVQLDARERRGGSAGALRARPASRYARLDLPGVWPRWRWTCARPALPQMRRLFRWAAKTHGPRRQIIRPPPRRPKPHAERAASAQNESRAAARRPGQAPHRHSASGIR